MARKKIPEYCCAKCRHYELSRSTWAGLHPCNAPTVPIEEFPASVRQLLNRTGLARVWMAPFTPVVCKPFEFKPDWDKDERLIRCGNK